MISRLTLYPIRVPSMSSTCVCASCTGSRQAGIPVAATSTTAWVNENPYLAPLPPPTPPGLQPYPLAPPGFPQAPPNQYPNPRVGWIPNQAVLFHSRKTTRSISSTPRFKHIRFSAFSKLPVELRVRIWAFSVPKSRVIELRTWKSNQEFAPLKISAGPHSVPSILHTNRESRTEGLRIYHLEEIGVSLWQDFNPSRVYIPWRYHPANRFSDPEFRVQSSQNANAIRPLLRTQDFLGRAFILENSVMPYAPQRIYLNYSRDTIYLGPEFSSNFLQNLLSSPDGFLELSRVQYLALDKSLWIPRGSRNWNALREALYALKNRPIREVYIVPDDDSGPLIDRWYYGKHELVLREPAFEYKFTPAGQPELARTAVEDLNAWIERLWTSNTLPASGGGSSQKAPRVQALVPKVSIKSVRRAGRSMSDYKDGVWQVQKALGDMNRWKTWVPAAEAG